MTDFESEETLRSFLTEYEEMLFEVSNRLYEARREFLREGFEGYVADTLYDQSDDTYKYWPVRDGGFFLGFNDPCPGEQEIIDEFVNATEFEYLGCGNARLVFGAPEPYPFAIKVGRCGTNLNFGHGRKHILSERKYSRAYADEAPIVPCLYCTSRGEFGVFPIVEADMAEEPPEDDAVFDRLREEYAEIIPEHERNHITEHHPNFGWWDGEPVIVDYFHVHRNEPLGVPDHVDGEWVIEEVDKLRQDGEKMDLDEEAQLIEPELDA